MTNGAYVQGRCRAGRRERRVDLALQELRDLARGIHPAVLSDSGLGSRGTRPRATLHRPGPRPPTTLRDRRFASAVEETAYFIVSEALANIAKHAAASEAIVSIPALNGDVIVDVSDDGVGGASLPWTAPASADSRTASMPTPGGSASTAFPGAALT